MKHTIEAAEKPLLDIFCDKYLFRIPSYQRPYAWTTEQTGELYDDVVSACGNNEDPASASPYFLGSIVLIKEPQKTDADVVDGQQRLTTLTILLSVLRDLADANFSSALQHHICQQGNPLTGAAGVFRLELRERDAEFFQKTIQDDKATSSLPDSRQCRDAQARIVENAVYLRARLKRLSDEQRRRLAIFIAQRCYLVVVAASDEESAFRVFSVLNSRGLDLSPTDILKAEIIGALPKASREDYTFTWEDIEDELGRLRFADLFGHIRTIHRQQKMQGTLIAEFREYVKARENPAKFIDSELSPYAEAYREITDKIFQSYKNADAINRELSHLARLDNFDWQPPAIEVIARRRNDPDLILRFIVDLERLAYALFLLRSDSTDRIRRYGRVLASLESAEDIFAEGSPLQLSASEKKSVSETLDGDIYSITRIRLPLLLRLDEVLADKSAVYDHSVLTVEHVLPQTPSADSQWMVDFPDETTRERWVHKLANLVLLTRRKNSQAGNLDFKAKKENYFRSKGGIANFALTSSVLAESTWTLTTLEKRQKELIEAVQQHWRLA
jgi:hypothetical protein